MFEAETSNKTLSSNGRPAASGLRKGMVYETTIWELDVEFVDTVNGVSQEPRSRRNMNDGRVWIRGSNGQ